jgi:hypothetical protein
LNIFDKFCPVCKKRNDREAMVCMYCGALLDRFPADGGGTTRNAEGQIAGSEGSGKWPLDEAMAPFGGIAFYVNNTSSPAFISHDQEFIVGRKVGPTTENILDLSKLGAYLLGLSRRHAKIRKTREGYEVIDLASTNGTWLNEQRLLPHQPYPLASGSQLRMGRMRFFVLFRSLVETKQRT